MTASKNLRNVDDDEFFVFLTKKAIEKIHFFDKILVFENGLDSINYLKENIETQDLFPQIILLDLSMPIMDGWQFLDQFNLLAPEIKKKLEIYVVSSSISPEDIKTVKSFSAVSDFIVKPISMDKLLEMIKTL
mgnify:CR=1 FL=1